mgnify:CR=1 FL=1
MNIRHTIKPSGPGNNIFLKQNVEVNNEITLRTRHDSLISTLGWSCSEVSWPAKEGVYELELECPVFLPKGVVCGVFLYQDDNNEIDIEFGRWNKFFNKNCQFVKQGEKPIRFWNFKRNNKIIIYYKKDYVTLCLNNKIYGFNHNSKFTDFIINLWIYGEPAEVQVKIKNFKFK